MTTKKIIENVVLENKNLLKEAKSTTELTAWAFKTFGRPFKFNEFNYFVNALKSIGIDHSSLGLGMEGGLSLGGFSKLMKESSFMQKIYFKNPIGGIFDRVIFLSINQKPKSYE